MLSRSQCTIYMIGFLLAIITLILISIYSTIDSIDVALLIFICLCFMVYYTYQFLRHISLPRSTEMLIAIPLFFIAFSVEIFHYIQRHSTGFLLVAVFFLLLGVWYAFRYFSLLRKEQKMS